MLSLDIETDPQAERLLSIALYGAGAEAVLLLTPAGNECPPGAHAFPTEKDLIEAFVRRVREADPDVLTGWNVVDFDLAVLARLAGRLGVRLELGRGAEPVRFRDAGQRGARQAEVPGRVVLDGIHLLRGAFVRMPDYGLDAVARQVLGEGKRITGHGRADEILRLFEEDRARLVDYNLTDARLALQILEKLQLVELAVERSRLTGMPLDRVSASIASFDFLYLAELRRKNVVAPSVSTVGEVEVATEGGHVLEPLPGLYRNVIVLDFKSLYPSLIRTFEIDPLGLVRDGQVSPESDPIVAPNGAAFARRRGILPEILDEIMPRREAARRAGDTVKSHAIKILMNSFYGCLGTPASRFHDARLANAITSFGREVLLWCRARIEAGGRRVLYGDTDSLFALSGEADALAARRLGASLAEGLTRELAEHIRETWRVESRLELQFDRLYLRLFLPAVRHGTAGARKRYAGLVAGDGESRVVFTGMEAVRGDWTELAKEVQRSLYARLFADEPVEEYLRAVVAEVKTGRLDEKLVYRKALRKSPEAYTATTPPHVAAARKMGRRTRGRIAYLVTVAGPEPADERKNAIDHAPLHREADPAGGGAGARPPRTWSSTRSRARSGSSPSSEPKAASAAALRRRGRRVERGQGNVDLLVLRDDAHHPLLEGEPRRLGGALVVGRPDPALERLDRLLDGQGRGAGRLAEVFRHAGPVGEVVEVAGRLLHPLDERARLAELESEALQRRPRGRGPLRPRRLFRLGHGPGAARRVRGRAGASGLRMRVPPPAPRAGDRRRSPGAPPASLLRPLRGAAWPAPPPRDRRTRVRWRGRDAPRRWRARPSDRRPPPRSSARRPRALATRGPAGPGGASSPSRSSRPRCAGAPPPRSRVGRRRIGRATPRCRAIPREAGPGVRWRGNGAAWSGSAARCGRGPRPRGRARRV